MNCNQAGFLKKFKKKLKKEGFKIDEVSVNVEDFVLYRYSKFEQTVAI